MMRQMHVAFFVDSIEPSAPRRAHRQAGARHRHPAAAQAAAAPRRGPDRACWSGPARAIRRSTPSPTSWKISPMSRPWRSPLQPHRGNGQPGRATRAGLPARSDQRRPVRAGQRRLSRSWGGGRSRLRRRRLARPVFHQGLDLRYNGPMTASQPGQDRHRQHLRYPAGGGARTGDHVDPAGRADRVARPTATRWISAAKSFTACCKRPPACRSPRSRPSARSRQVYRT